MAFFDVDDTLISVKSMLSFQDFWYQIHPHPEEQKGYRETLQQVYSPSSSWGDLNRQYYQYFSGRPVAEVENVALQWFQKTSSQPGFYHSPVVDIMHRHKQRGHECILVSGSFPSLLEPIAVELGADHILATQLEQSLGVYTGKIIPPQTIGEGKVIAIADLLAKRGIDRRTCYAYGDDISDLPMLEYVGYPHAIAGGRQLQEKARKNSWPIILPV
ncbi:HAD family hydrolase [Gilvimarinus xylanilyticus]|uniref:HAD-IB family hydrolase n=1 Tax=Gilvimarinus xylanilyticus TaxID=2944139 RepID=A0A9X2I2K3_9GAMM|nr:HAD family hydrolase [Gilvimarinus xylanilyticus]MCP8899648.1 HAD-IB family hydrolase [Gilvimarinus xylanilyticus]